MNLLVCDFLAEINQRSCRICRWFSTWDFLLFQAVLKWKQFQDVNRINGNDATNKWKAVDLEHFQSSYRIYRDYCVLSDKQCFESVNSQFKSYIYKNKIPKVFRRTLWTCVCSHENDSITQNVRLKSNYIKKKKINK